MSFTSLAILPICLFCTYETNAAAVMGAVALTPRTRETGFRGTLAGFLSGEEMPWLVKT